MTLTPPAFRFVSELVCRETAMVLGPGKEYLVEARLLPLARAAGVATVGEYVNLLRTTMPHHRRAAVDALTINETSWFRDREPFHALRHVIVPELVAARQAHRHVTVWSAGCSSGQEPYSIAMTLRETLPEGWTAEVLATDVSTAMLDRVTAGRYAAHELDRGLPEEMLARYFTPAGREWQVAPALREMVHVRHLNLAVPFRGLPSFDVVFLRNVLIYFDVAVKRTILDRVRGVVRPDGYLLLGATETTLGIGAGWEQHAVGNVRACRPRRTAASAPARAVATPAPALAAAPAAPTTPVRRTPCSR